MVPGANGVAASGANPVPEAVAAALADLRQPDLSGLPEEQVRAAAAQMFGEQGLRPEWLDWLRSRIVELSNGMTRLEDADSADFLYQSKEWGAVYQRLVGLFTDRLVIIGNSTPQFLFVPSR